MDLRSVRALLRTAFVAVSVTVFAGCGPDPADATIERETFVQAYVDLRVAALAGDGDRIDEEDRAEVLARHGLTEESLVRFIEVHAHDLELMRDVWNDVELRMDALRPDSIGP